MDFLVKVDGTGPHAVLAVDDGNLLLAIGKKMAWRKVEDCEFAGALNPKEPQGVFPVPPPEAKGQGPKLVRASEVIPFRPPNGA